MFRLTCSADFSLYGEILTVYYHTVPIRTSSTDGNRRDNWEIHLSYCDFILNSIYFIRHNLYNIILNFILCKMTPLQYIISNNAKNRLEYDEQHLAISVSCCIDWCLWDVLSCVPLFYPSFRLSKLWLTPHTQAATFNPIFCCFVTIYRNSLRQV